MVERNPYRYDVFISYSPADEAWVNDTLCPQLESAGLRVAVGNRDFEVGLPRITNIERVIDGSRHTLVVASPDWLHSQWTDFEVLLIASGDPTGRRRRVIPLLLRACPLPPHLAILTYADFTDASEHDQQMERLISGLVVKSKIFISYKRNVEPDQSLALQLQNALEEVGHSVFIDQKIAPGVAWAQEIHRQVEASDYFIVLLSAASVQSEMVAEEIEYASDCFARTAKARLLPIRIGYDDSLPYQLSHHLEELQYARWRTDDDTESMIREISDAIRRFADLKSSPSESASSSAADRSAQAPKPYADPRFIDELYEPGGAVRLRSDFYIERMEDRLLRRELAKSHGTTTTIRAPRQSGKSSLLIRGAAQAKKQDSKVVYIDLQRVDKRYLEDLDQFLHYLATRITHELRIDPGELEWAWKGGLGTPDKITYLMQDSVLGATDSTLILALDEVDRLLSTPFHDSFFGLLRAWHNSRALNELWEQLDMVLVISTEPNLLIRDITQSPFNVGQKLRLQDFSEAEVQTLNRHYRSPLQAAQFGDIMSFLGGHPYLTQRALYTMVSRDMAWDQLVKESASERSPFGDHLRHYLWRLRDRPELRDALKSVTRTGECPDEPTYYRLVQAGLVRGASRNNCTYRCRLYETYFKDRL